MNDKNQFQNVNDRDLQSIGGGDGFYINVGSSQIVVMPSGIHLGEILTQGESSNSNSGNLTINGGSGHDRINVF